MGRTLWIARRLAWFFCLVGVALGQTPSHEQKCSDNLQLLLRSLAKYAKDHQNKYPDKLSDLVPRYLSQLPACPAGGETYSRYSVIAHNPERAVLICSYRSHALKPPDYLVLSGDRGLETPFSRVADPSICRRTLVQLSKRLEQNQVLTGQFPETLPKEERCSCGDPIQYHVLDRGRSYLAHCPGAAHLGSGLAPFSPFITPEGLKEDSLFLGKPVPAPLPVSGLSTGGLAAAGLAVFILLGLALHSRLQRRIKLD